MEASRAAYAKRGVETWKTSCMEAWVLDKIVWKTTITFAAEKSIRDQAITLCPTAIRYVQRALFIERRTMSAPRQSTLKMRSRLIPETVMS